MVKKTLDEVKLLHVFSTFNIAGPQVRFCDVVNNLGNNFKHTVVSMDNQYGALSKINAGVSVNKIDIFFEKKSVLRNIFRFRSIINTIKPDLLLTYNWGSIEWIISNYIFSVCPMIHTEDGFNDDEQQKQKIRRILTRQIVFKKLSFLVVPSKTLEKIATNIWCQPSSRIAYIPNGIDTAMYQQKTESIDSEKLIIGTVAAIRKVKRIDRLIDLFKRMRISHPNLELSIVGDGPELRNLKKMAEGLNNIKFNGFQKNPVPHIKEMDIFLISSTTEQMPYTVLEAMALSKPIFGSDVGDIRWMVSESNLPYLVDFNDIEQAIDVLNKLIENNIVRKVIGDSNKFKCCNDYNLDKMIKSYLDLYCNCISQ